MLNWNWWTPNIWKKLVYWFLPYLAEMKFNIAQQVGFYVNVKMFLQGPYSTSTHALTTVLNSTTKHLIPTAQPYSGAPWNYAGTESVTAGFWTANPNTVTDWVLVELRTGTAANTMVAQRAGFLLKSGRIVDIDGTSDLNFPSIAATGNYYVVIHHRNHLALMSAATINGTAAQYDMSVLANIYGGDAKNVEGSVYAAYAGDCNASGTVEGVNPTGADVIYYNAQSPPKINVYNNADVNLDGQINSTDLNSYIVANNTKTTNVPS